MNNDNPTKEMKEYALQEMIRLIGNMRTRPIVVFSQKIGNDKRYYLGTKFCDDLILSLKKQYSNE